MYKQGDQVVYGIHGVCRIVALEMKYIDKKKIEYYVLEPANQPGTRYYIPTQNAAAVAKMKPLLTEAELNTLIDSHDFTAVRWIDDENQRKQYYRQLINSADRVALLQMIHALHVHKQTLTATGRKFHLCDENFLRDAKALMDGEIAHVLSMEQCDIGPYMQARINKKELL